MFVKSWRLQHIPFRCVKSWQSVSNRLNHPQNIVTVHLSKPQWPRSQVSSHVGLGVQHQSAVNMMNMSYFCKHHRNISLNMSIHVNMSIPVQSLALMLSKLGACKCHCARAISWHENEPLSLHGRQPSLRLRCARHSPPWNWQKNNCNCEPFRTLPIKESDPLSCQGVHDSIIIFIMYCTDAVHWPLASSHKISVGTGQNCKSPHATQFHLAFSNIIYIYIYIHT